MVETIIFSVGQLVYKDSKTQEFDWVLFRVSAKQVRWLKEFDKDEVTVLVAHADEGGNFEGVGYDMVERLDPDLIFCCYPSAAKRTNPKWSQKIALWHEGELLLAIQKNTVSITKG